MAWTCARHRSNESRPSTHKELQPAQEEQKRAAGPKDYPGEFSFSLTNVSSKYSKAV